MKMGENLLHENLDYQSMCQLDWCSQNTARGLVHEASMATCQGKVILPITVAKDAVLRELKRFGLEPTDDQQLGNAKWWLRGRFRLIFGHLTLLQHVIGCTSYDS